MSQIILILPRAFSQLVLILLLGMTIPHAAQAEGLDYQKRGSYWEGTKAKPVNSLGLELISAVVDYQDQPDRLGTDFHARFFLKDPAPVCLVARERDNRRFYWLDQISPQQPWVAGYGNEFVWPTSPVIKSLNLKLYDLGVLVRLGCDQSTADERVAPVVLYQSQAPKDVSGYVFTFKMSEGLNLKAKIFTGTGDQPIYQQDLGNKSGPGIFDVVWSAQDRPEGDYILAVSGYRLSNNDKVYQAVHFHHQPRLE